MIRTLIFCLVLVVAGGCGSYREPDRGPFLVESFRETGLQGGIVVHRKSDNVVVWEEVHQFVDPANPGSKWRPKPGDWVILRWETVEKKGYHNLYQIVARKHNDPR